MVNDSKRRLDMAEHFSGGGLNYGVMVTTTNKRTGQVRTAPINEVARNKLRGSWSGDVLTLTAGPSGHHVLTLAITATDVDGGTAGDSLQLVVDATGAPGQPVMSGLNPESGKVTLFWKPPSKDGGVLVTGYDVDIGIGGDRSAGPETVTGITGTSTAVTGLANGMTYDLRVRAVNSDGVGAWSETVQLTPVAPATLTLALPDLELANSDTHTIDTAKHFSGTGLTYGVMVTTTPKRTGRVRIAPINEVARNKVRGSWSGDVLTLTAGPSGHHVLEMEVTATDIAGGRPATNSS